MTRSEFPKSVKREAFERAGGKCEECTRFLTPGKFQYDHVLADGLGGKPTLENCRVLCDWCHGLKSANDDVPKMAKADRGRAKIMEGKKSKRPVPGSRGTKFRKRMDGTVERR
ncbi:MAG: HNH endonuclease signature motif containing protein [Methyloceanibacter sp.]|nr:HNH endonuclease signature motif containing protein [Methyloceanibacter sp.]